MTNLINEAVCPMAKGICHCVNEVCNDESVSVSIRSWIGAVGSILVAIVAIFQSWIRSLWKAKLSFALTNECPHFIVDNVDGLTGKLWIEVHNDSNFIEVETVRVVIEEIRIRGNASETGAYKKTLKFHPRHLCWSARVDEKGVSITISPKSSEFVQIATIARPVINLRNASGKNPPKSPPSIPRLSIVGRDLVQKIEGDFQDVIIRLRITGTTIKVQHLCVKISWQGTCGKHLEDAAKDFLCCQPLTETEYAVLSGIKE